MKSILSMILLSTLCLACSQEEGHSVPSETEQDSGIQSDAAMADARHAVDAADRDGSLPPDLSVSDTGNTPEDTGSDVSSGTDSGATDTGLADMNSSTDMAEYECPPPRDHSMVCTAVLAWGKDPRTGECCQYPDPCSVLEEWEVFNSLSECENA